MACARSSCVRFAAVVALLASLVLSLVTGPVQVSAQSDQDETGVSGNSYVSPTFGYSFEWDRTWDVTDETVEDDYNMLRLEDRNSFIWFEGYNFPTDPAECVETVVGTLEDIEGLSDLDFTETDTDAPDSAAADVTFLLANEDGEDVDYSGYVECRVINDGGVTLSISHYGVTEGWDDSSEGRAEMLDSLETEGAAPDDEPTDTGDEDTDTEPADTSDTDDLLQEVQGDGDVPSNIDDVLLLFQASINDIVLYWQRQYPLVSGGQEFVPPTFVPYVGTMDTACGPLESFDEQGNWGTGPVQCGADQTIYLDVHFVQFQYDQLGGEVPFLVTAVVAHEMGHHVQDLLGMEACYETPCLDPNQLTGLEIEYMADCFAGAWSADAQLRGRLGLRDVDLAIVQWATTLGGGTESADWGSHGTGSERTWWFLNGFVEGANKCFETSDVTRNWMETSGGETPEATEDATEETPEETPENGGSGDTAQLGDSVETSQGTLIATETKLTDSIDNRDADGQFAIVYIEIEMADDGPYAYDGWTVVDADGNVYELDERATDLLLASAYQDGMDEEFESDAGYGIAFVFDVPADASGLTLVNEDEGVAIQLDI